MNSTLLALTFDEPDIAQMLDALSEEALDNVDFGVIGFDALGFVRKYNRHESEAAGLSPGRVLGRLLFAEVAPCMNNFMVAQRFHDAQNTGHSLDVCIDYVLTLRMRPTRVALRLIMKSNVELAYIFVRRKAPA